MSVHLQVGKQKKVAVVFSCPGRREELAGCPAAGITGKNLDTLLSLLAEALHRSDLSRENITITNVWPTVEYRARTGRSQATGKEACAPGNLQRLQGELSEITDLVIFCGERAREAARKLSLERKPKLVFIGHPGLRGLSSIHRDVAGEPIVAAARLPAAAIKSGKEMLQRENTRKRLAVLVHSILLQLGRGEAEEP
jgi:uracil-DNA glycosylase